MKLLSLHIENFGTLHEVDEHFDEGLNVRLHPNGYGKSTLAVFIKAILYGLPVTTRRSLIENERKRYTPWQGGAYGGSLDIEIDGKAYRIERLFGAKESDDTLAVLSLETGEAVREDWAVAPGERLFGVGIAAYERSAYISQRPDELTKDGMDSIHAKLNHMDAVADDLGNFDIAMTALEHRRQYYAHIRGRGGAIADSEDTLAVLENRVEECQRARDALAATHRRIDEAERAIKQINDELAVLQEKESALHRAREAKAIEDRMAAAEQEQAMLRKQIEALRHDLGGTVPTDAMIGALEEALAARDAATGLISSIIPDEHEIEQLQILQTRFGNKIPTPEQWETLRRFAVDSSRSALLAENLASSPNASARFTEDRLQELLRERQTLNNRLGQATAARDEIDDSTVGRAPANFALICAALIALGLMIGGIFLLPLLFVGVAIAIGTAIIAIRQKGRRTTQVKSSILKAARLDSEIATLQNDIHATEIRITAAEHDARFTSLWKELLSGLPCPAPTDAPSQVERVYADARRLCTLRAKQAEQAESVARGNAVRKRAEETIRTLLAPMPNAPTDAAQALRRLTEQRVVLSDCIARYDRKQQELARLREQYDIEGEAHRAALKSAETTDETELQTARDALQAELSLRSQTLLREQQAAERLRVEADELDESENEKARRLAILEEQKSNLDAILQAEKYLKLAREHLSSRYLSTMQQRFGHYMQLLTGRDAPVFTMDGQFRVKMRAAGAGRDTDAFSVGTRDLIALCERLALLDTMYEGNRPFLVLDDPFTNMDDDTIRRAHRLLRTVSERYQLLYLTCHSGRAPHENDI